MIEFNAKDHTYKMDGVQLPSVSQILQEAGKVPKFPNNGAAQRGTDIHNICALIDYGIISLDQVEERYAGYVSAWIRFQNDNPVSFLHIEEPMGSSIYGFAGTADRIGSFERKTPGMSFSGTGIFDIKSGSKTSFHALQLNGYRMLAEEYFGLKIDHLWGVYLRDTGRYSVESYEISDEFLDILRRRAL